MAGKKKREAKIPNDGVRREKATRAEIEACQALAAEFRALMARDNMFSAEVKARLGLPLEAHVELEQATGCWKIVLPPVLTKAPA